ncbi:MAG: hypothetical protein ACTSRZ_16015 [Promethearchaeota archaeon]
MEETSSKITINTQTFDSLLLKEIVKNRIIVKFPIVVEKGKAEFRVTATRENLMQFS